MIKFSLSAAALSFLLATPALAGPPPPEFSLNTPGVSIDAVHDVPNQSLSGSIQGAGGGVTATIDAHGDKSVEAGSNR